MYEGKCIKKIYVYLGIKIFVLKIKIISFNLSNYV